MANRFVTKRRKPDSALSQSVSTHWLIIMIRIALFTVLLATVAFSWPDLATAQVRKAAANAQQDDGWVDVLPGGISARMRMPVEPRHIQRTMTPTSDSEITLDTYMGTVQNGNLTFVFSHFKMVETPIGKKAIATRYDEAVQGQVVRVGGELESYKVVELQRNEGRDFVYHFSDNKDNKFKIQTRLFIRLDSMYEIKVVALKDNFSDEDAQKFFDSFMFAKANPMPVEEPAEEEKAADGNQ